MIENQNSASHPVWNLLVANTKILLVWTGAAEEVAGVSVINAENKFVIPGLFDCHAHLFTGCFDLFLANGITTVRDMASTSKQTLAWRTEIEGGKIAGPRIFTHGEFLDGPTSVRRGQPYNICVDGEDEITIAVQRLAEAKVDAIKLYSELPLSVFSRGIIEAHNRGLPVAAHVGHSRKVTVRQAVTAGVDAIEHTATFLPDLFYPGQLQELMGTIQTTKTQLRGYIAWSKVDLKSDLVKSLINLLAEKRVYHTPTLVNIENQIKGGGITVEEKSLLDKLPVGMVHNWRAVTPSISENWTESEYAVARQGFENIKQLAFLMYEAGAKLGVGSDTPNPWTFPGPGLFREMELLVECGIPARKVIQMATRDAAAFLGNRFTDVGVISEGKTADIVILNDNPANNISACRSIAHIVRNGQLPSHLENQT